ncbi:hypothetical protein [Actinosynnema sp. NPDC023587]|uniref:hypothetical protein n=1 Tax=Actinosynnema sp. NPDC023587 TaxID=3154695 RepID=UPI0033DC6E1B
MRADLRADDDIAADGRGPVQVMALRAADKLVPLRPGGTTLTIRQPVDGIELSGEPPAEITVTVDADRWVPAARIADAPKPHLI